MNAQNPGANFLGSVQGLIEDTLKDAKGASKDSLYAFAKIGDALNDARAFFAEDKTRGVFAEWAQANFGFSKAWAYRLIQLHNAWGDVKAAFDWAEKEGRDISKMLSVDGAMKLLNEWKAQTDETAKAKAQEKAEKAEKAKAEREAEKAKAETEAERLRKYIAKLEKENAKLKAELAAAKGESPKAETGNAKAETGPDAKTRDRAKKVWGLYTKGATDGEKAAAKARLDDIASKCGMSFDEFVKACGLA